MLQRPKCYMILAMLVVTGLASHDGTYVTQKESTPSAQKTAMVVVHKEINRPK